MKQREMGTTLEDAAEATLWIVEQGGCQEVFHAMSEEDVVRIMTHPATMISSDSEVPTFGRANPHPRSDGTFARVLGVYVRDRKVLGLEEAIRKMTAFPVEKPHASAEGFSHVIVKGQVVFENEKMTDARPGRVLYGPGSSSFSASRR